MDRSVYIKEAVWDLFHNPLHVMSALVLAGFLLGKLFIFGHAYAMERILESRELRDLFGYSAFKDVQVNKVKVLDEKRIQVSGTFIKVRDCEKLLITAKTQGNDGVWNYAELDTSNETPGVRWSREVSPNASAFRRWEIILDVDAPPPLFVQVDTVHACKESIQANVFFKIPWGNFNAE